MYTHLEYKFGLKYDLVISMWVTVAVDAKKS